MSRERLGVDLRRMAVEEGFSAAAAFGRQGVLAVWNAIGRAASRADELAHGLTLDLAQAHHLKGQLFVEGLALAPLDLAQEVFFEPDLG